MIYQGAYYHELTEDQRVEIHKQKITIGEFIKNYKQPDWCEYPEALGMYMGCWSLCFTTGEISRGYCARCDEYRGPCYAGDLHTGCLHPGRLSVTLFC